MPHHTFFEMLGNWSFGDYYKKGAIEWAWQLLTGVWGLEKDRLYATVFKDDKGDIPTDEEAAANWLKQPGFDPVHLFYFGRKDNFWEMAETGPCGPCSEIHYDLRPSEGKVTEQVLDSDRFVELWNLVFIQYNRLGPDTLEPLPAKHVDTGMGFERLVAILQGVDSNYKTDLFTRSLDVLRGLTGHSEKEVFADFTPYRVLGIKRHRYGQGLSGVGRQMPDDVRRAPNDRFEIRSLRYGKDSASEQQHYFIDRVRQMAREIVNERRGLDLDVYNAQELNWATQRADDMKIDIPKAASDNVQDSLDYYTFQH